MKKPRPSASAIADADIKPYLAAVLLEGKSADTVGKALASQLLDKMRGAITDSDRSKRALIGSSPVSRHGALHVGRLIYRERASPAWLRTDALCDETYHLAVVAVSGNAVALIVSDSAMRDAMLASMVSIGTPVNRTRIKDAFVGPEAKTIWLNGVHTSTAVKADSKALNGTSLEHALDPLGDQSYALSAIRSHPAVGGLQLGARRPVVGVAPGASRVWVSRPATWNDFVLQVEALLKHISAPRSAVTIYDFLSQSVSDLTSLADAYDVSVLPAAILEEGVDSTPEQRDEAFRWAYETDYRVIAGTGANLSIEVGRKTLRLGMLHLKVDMTNEGRVRITPAWSPLDSALDADRASCARFLADAEQVKIYYDSGHTIADGYCFATGFTDHLLNWEFKDFTGYRVGEEKPGLSAGTKLADAIGTATDQSLFAFVQKRLCTDGWLACDDGAMELADFVHLSKAGQITLIHVKGASSSKPSRKVSVSDYELVVSQGVKNIRHLDRDKLAEVMERGSGKDISRAVWHDGVRQPNRNGMIDALRKLPRSATRKLLILLPRLTRKEYDICIGKGAAKSRVQRFRQLNALMLAARISVLGVGAEFEAVVSE